jgi:hypothetical protein
MCAISVTHLNKMARRHKLRIRYALGSAHARAANGGARG